MGIEASARQAALAVKSTAAGRQLHHSSGTPRKQHAWLNQAPTLPQGWEPLPPLLPPPPPPLLLVAGIYCGAGHFLYSRAPKMVLPTRTLVLPISTACSKSPLMPMLRAWRGREDGAAAQLLVQAQ